MAERLLYQYLAGDVIQHITVVVDNAVLAMCGVGVECHVGNHTDLGHGAFDFRDRALH